MDKRTSAKNKASNIVKEYRLSSPSLDNLIIVAKNLGYEIIDFGKKQNSGGTAALIKELSVQKNIETSSAFTYQYNDIKIIFLCDALNEREKCYALAHELGHIVCGHMEYSHCSSDGIEDEFEANEFAHYLLYPKAHQKVRNYLLSHKSSAIVTGTIVLVIIIGIVFAASAAQENRYYGDYYVTTSGQKYHTKECFTISGSESAHRMTKVEHESGQYSSCSICLPNN